MQPPVLRPPPKRRPAGIKSREAGPRIVPAPATCPFCGGLALPKRPALDRLSGSSLALGPASLSLAAGTGGEEYYACRGCGMAFVFAEREIETMLPGMEMDTNIPDLVEFYYGGGLTVRALLTEHRTAMVRKVRAGLSFLSPAAARSELIMCFNHRGVRTFGSFRRRRGGRGFYYTFEELNRA